MDILVFLAGAAGTVPRRIPSVASPICSAKKPQRHALFHGGSGKKIPPGRTAASLTLAAPAKSCRSRRPSLQGERVKLAAHFGPKRVVNDLVLLDARFAAKRFGDNGCRIVVAVAGEIADRHIGVGNMSPDQPFNIACSHRHGESRRWGWIVRLGPAYQVAPRRKRPSTAATCQLDDTWTAAAFLRLCD